MGEEAFRQDGCLQWQSDLGSASDEMVSLPDTRAPTRLSLLSAQSHPASPLPFKEEADAVDPDGRPDSRMQSLAEHEMELRMKAMPTSVQTNFTAISHPTGHGPWYQNGSGWFIVQKC